LLTHPGILFLACGQVLNSDNEVYKIASHFYELLFSYILTRERVQAAVDASDLIVIFAPGFRDVFS